MKKLMKPITFGCDNGFQEVFYNLENPTDNSKQEAGNVFCYLSKLTDEEKKDPEVLKKCLSMKSGQCWK
jgi:hypothetical protein